MKRARRVIGGVSLAIGLLCWLVCRVYSVPLVDFQPSLVAGILIWVWLAAEAIALGSMIAGQERNLFNILALVTFFVAGLYLSFFVPPSEIEIPLVPHIWIGVLAITWAFVPLIDLYYLVLMRENIKSQGEGK